MSQYDTESLYQFLTSTPEKGLRKMMVDAKFTEPHFNMLMKVVRATSQSEFDTCFTKQDFPKVKFNDKETAIKAKFWSECMNCLNARGLLAPAQAKKVEKIAA